MYGFQQEIQSELRTAKSGKKQRKDYQTVVSYSLRQLRMLDIFSQSWVNRYAVLQKDVENGMERACA